MSAPDVGKLRHIRIGHDSDDGWFLRQVVVVRRDTHQRWVFPCYRWLDFDKDDLCPYRTLLPQLNACGEAVFSLEESTGEESRNVMQTAGF